MKPAFIIIGERKCGTSSLFRYLIDHPAVLPGKKKEPQFFSRPFSYQKEHFPDYLAHFPRRDDLQPVTLTWPELNAQEELIEEKIIFKRNRGQEYITGEASANLLAEANPEHVRYFLPKVKLIAIFREPAARAHSHFRMFQRFQEEGRPIDMDLGDFTSCMEKELQRYTEGRETTFLEPGVYIRSLQPWYQAFPSGQLKILFTQDLDMPRASYVLNELSQWLGLETHDFDQIATQQFNKARQKRMPKDIYQQLRRFYEPFDLALEKFIQRPIPWLNTSSDV